MVDDQATIARQQYLRGWFQRMKVNAVKKGGGLLAGTVQHRNKQKGVGCSFGTMGITTERRKKEMPSNTDRAAGVPASRNQEMSRLYREEHALALMRTSRFRCGYMKSPQFRCDRP